MSTQIRFNGAEYSSPDDMPAGVRAAYDRALELAAQGKSGGLPGGHVNVKVTTKVRLVSGGKTYENPDDMPPDVRAQYDKAMGLIDKNHDGVPDMLEKYVAPAPTDLSSRPSDAFATTDQSRLQPLAPSQPVIAPDGPNYRNLIVIAGFVIIVVMAAALVVLLAVAQH
jgi:hypothetical protein